MQRHAGGEVELAVVIVDDADAEVELQVRPVDVGPAPDEAAGLRGVGGEQAACRGAGNSRGRPAPRGSIGKREAEQARPLGAEVGDIVAMVLKIGADFWRVVHDLDAEAPSGARPDRSPDTIRSCGEPKAPPDDDDLAPRVEPLAPRRRGR